MASVNVSIEGVPQPKAGHSTPRKLVRGRRLKCLVKAIHALKSLSNQDDAENRKSAIKNYSPFLILDTPGSKTNNAFDRLLTALQEAHGAKA